MDKQLLGREKLIPISYDLTLSQLGLSMEESVQMKDTNIVIHCAATSEYESSLEWNLEVYINTKCFVLFILKILLDECVGNNKINGLPQYMLKYK